MIKRSILFNVNNIFIRFFVFKIDSFKLKINIFIAITNDVICSFRIIQNFYKIIF